MIRLTEQLEQVQKDLSRNIDEAERIGECLVLLGARLRQEPWRWAIDRSDTVFPDSQRTHPIDSELVDALNRHRIAWLLEDIRILRRREAELKRLAVA